MSISFDYTEGKGKGKGKGKFIRNVVDFFQGKKKIKPKQILKSISTVFKITANLAGKNSNTAQYSERLEKAGNLLSNVSSKLPQGGSGKTIGEYVTECSAQQCGRGKFNIKTSTKKFVAFLQGKTKIKPSDLLKIGQVITGVIGAGASAIFGPAVGGPILAGSAALGRTSGKLKQSGKGKGKGKEPKKKKQTGLFGKARVSKRDNNKAHTSCVNNLKNAGYKSSAARGECRQVAQDALYTISNWKPEETTIGTISHASAHAH